MNKMQRSKGQKRTIVSLIIAILALTMFTVGMTFAYFTASSSATSDTMQFGTLVVDFSGVGPNKIGVKNEHQLTSPIIPGCTLSLSGTITTEGSTIDALLRIKPSITVTKANGKNLDEINASAKLLDILVSSFEGEDNGNWLRPRDNSVPAQPTGKYLYYTSVVTPTNPTVSLEGVKIRIPTDDVGNDWQGASFTVSIEVQAIQAEHVNVDLSTGNAQQKANAIANANATNYASTAWAEEFGINVSFMSGSTKVAENTIKVGDSGFSVVPTALTTDSEHEFTGWFTAETSGIQVLDANGSLVKNAGSGTYTTNDITPKWAYQQDLILYGVIGASAPAWSYVSFVSNNWVDTDEVTDFIRFGTHPDSNGQTPMYWQILAKDDNANPTKALLANVYVLTGEIAMDADRTGIYGTSDHEMSAYLNGDFINNSFNDKEKALIYGSTVGNVSNINAKTTMSMVDALSNAKDGGGSNYVFLLSGNKWDNEPADVHQVNGYFTNYSVYDDTKKDRTNNKNSAAHYRQYADGTIGDATSWWIRYYSESYEPEWSVDYIVEPYDYLCDCDSDGESGGVLPALFINLSNS